MLSQRRILYMLHVLLCHDLWGYLDNVTIHTSIITGISELKYHWFYAGLCSVRHIRYRRAKCYSIWTNLGNVYQFYAIDQYTKCEH